MMDWKTRQKIYHLMTAYDDRGDSLLEQKIIEEFDHETIIERALSYPIIQSSTLFYPGKSYAVAVVYAILLSKYFGGDIISYLSDSELLFNNDPYFKPYQLAPNIYDKILLSFPQNFEENMNDYTLDFQKTVDYFMKEFLLHEETQIYANS